MTTSTSIHSAVCPQFACVDCACLDACFLINATLLYSIEPRAFQLTSNLTAQHKPFCNKWGCVRNKRVWKSVDRDNCWSGWRLDFHAHGLEQWDSSWMWEGGEEGFQRVPGNHSQKGWVKHGTDVHTSPRMCFKTKLRIPFTRSVQAKKPRLAHLPLPPTIGGPLNYYFAFPGEATCDFLLSPLPV